jgi:mannose-6-phosphate isomerase-like protein (cupin superfamily)
MSSLQAFSLDGLRAAHQAAGNRYLEFLRVPALSAGLYKLPAEGVDPQKPHAEDEIYYIVAGRSKFTCEGKTVDIEPGMTVYVAARDEHRFHDITEDLEILVVFAPAEIEPGA